MPQSARLFLADIVDPDIRDLFDHLQLLRFTAGRKVQFQFDTAVKMILDSTFAAPGNNQNIFYSRSKRFFNNILDRRLINDRQHLLRCSFSSRQKTRA